MHSSRAQKLKVKKIVEKSNNETLPQGRYIALTLRFLLTALFRETYDQR
jgi:hypothetical protein